MTVLIYVDTSKDVAEHDPEGIAFEYEVLEGTAPHASQLLNSQS